MISIFIFPSESVGSGDLSSFTPLTRFWGNLDFEVFAGRSRLCVRDGVLRINQWGCIDPSLEPSLCEGSAFSG